MWPPDCEDGELRVGSWAGIRLRQEPEASPFIRALRGLSDPAAQATVTFKDASILAGTPSFWTDDPDARRELFLTHPRWFDKETGEWTDRRDAGGVLINIDDVWAIELDSVPE
jgi:hypothetical protein